jgi:hypothetical protein
MFDALLYKAKEAFIWDKAGRQPWTLQVTQSNHTTRVLKNGGLSHTHTTGSEG